MLPWFGYDSAMLGIIKCCEGTSTRITTIQTMHTWLILKLMMNLRKSS